MAFVWISDIPSQRRPIWLGGLIIIGQSDDGAAIVKSSDGGFTWVEKTPFATGGGVELYTFGTHDNVTLFVGAYDLKTYKSTNAGETFAQVGNASQQPVSCVSVDGSIVLYGTYGGALRICRSTNGGASFSNINLGGDGQVSSLVNLGGGVILAMGHWVNPSGPDRQKLFRSDDNGASWTEIGYLGATSTGLYDNVGFCNLGGGVVLAGTYAEGKVFKSEDYGLTWEDKGQICASATSVNAFCRLSNGNILAASVGGGVNINISGDDGETWSVYQSLVPLDVVGVQAIFQLSDESIIAMASYDGGASFAAYREILQPLPPTLTGVPGPGPKQNTLTIGTIPGGDAYNLYYSTSPGVTQLTGTKIAGVTSPYLHTGLQDGTTYYYVATCVRDGLESEDSAELSLTTFGTLDASEADLIGQMRLSIHLRDEIDAFDVFSLINSAVASYLFNDHLGKFRYVVYSPPTGASIMQFTEEDIDSFSEDVDATNIISKVKAKFQHRVTQDYWQVRFVERLQSQYLQRSPMAVLKDIELPFVQAVDALRTAQRTALHEGVPQRVYKCRVSSKGWTLLPSNFIHISYARHSVNGIFEVLETKRDLKTGKVDLVVGGLRGVVSGGTSGGFGYPGHWCAEDVFSPGLGDGVYTDTEFDGADTDEDVDGALTEVNATIGSPVFPSSLGGGPASPWDRNWSDAQKAYAKQNFGYWCDENGFADPLDPESYLCSTWI